MSLDCRYSVFCTSLPRVLTDNRGAFPCRSLLTCPFIVISFALFGWLNCSESMWSDEEAACVFYQQTTATLDVEGDMWDVHTPDEGAIKVALSPSAHPILLFAALACSWPSGHCKGAAAVRGSSMGFNFI